VKGGVMLTTLMIHIGMRGQAAGTSNTHVIGILKGDDGPFEATGLDDNCGYRKAFKDATPIGTS